MQSPLVFLFPFECLAIERLSMFSVFYRHLLISLNEQEDYMVFVARKKHKHTLEQFNANIYLNDDY